MNPLLSIGIIFKNELRCLERCVKSLQTLRNTLPCELVMADTGSDDGSRAIAEKYADILFDFPWINDFAAARNAVIDHCSGEWYLSLDADEWLDGDISQLINFLTHPELWEFPLCGMMLRNYYTPELDGEANDFLAVRLGRISTGVRYTGAIHELWDAPPHVYGLGRMLIHHDGYVDYTGDRGKEKQDRNMELLREKLSKDPNDLKTLLQCIESSVGDSSCESYIRQAVDALKRDAPGWKYYAPPILRYAVIWAAGRHLPELEDWASWMLSKFPDSPYTNIDGAYTLFIHYMDKKDYAKAIPLGEKYLQTIVNYRAGNIDYTALIFGPFTMSTKPREDSARIVLTDAYFHEHEIGLAKETLLSIDRAGIHPEMVKNYIAAMMNLHAQGDTDLSPILADFWEKTDRPEPCKKQGEACRQAMAAAAETAFSPAHRAAEDEQGFRHAYTLFLPLAGKCETGNAARVLAADSAEEMEAALLAVEDWTAFPVPALAHAIKAGVPFPLPAKPLTLEEMDSLAARLAREPESLCGLLDTVPEENRGWQTLVWVRGLALAAVQSCEWGDPERGVNLARTFARVEGAFLGAYYTPEVLREEENLRLLPPMHRLGWYCARAFAALDAGEKADYVRLLREGLVSCPSAGRMVECLLARLEEEEQIQAMPELLRLADRIRTLLAQYPADDPAVTALKQSEAYQKVAHLIEEPDLFGGLTS